MKRRQLIKHLDAWDCEFYEEGTRHTLYINPKTNQKASVPRHREIDNNLAKQICKELGIPIIGRR